LIQELERPRVLGPLSAADGARELIFTFYNGELYRIAVNYDRYETEGMTGDDVVEAISKTYGNSNTPAKTPVERYGVEEQVLARWEDAEYRFDLIRSSYGPSFKLIGMLKRLEAPARLAIAEATRLDTQEAPQRDAARIAAEDAAAKAKLDDARRTNKPKFHP
jgi:hypothetical protein